MNFSAWNSVVETIYASAARPDDWPETIQAIADILDARGATLLFRRDDGRTGVIVSPTLVGLAEEYNTRWHPLDVRAEYIFRVIASGQRDVAADHTVFAETAPDLPIFRDFLWPNGLGWAMGVSVSPIPGTAVALNVLRAHGKPGFDAAAQEQLLALSRHVERALSLSIRLMDAEAERLGLSEALDRIVSGAIIVDADRRVLFANRTAERMLGLGLVVSAGRLRARNATAEQAFAARFGAVGLRDEALNSAPPLLVPNGERGLIVQVLPLRSPTGAPSLRTASAIVLIEDLDKDQPFDPAITRDAFKLTLGEARLAALIGAGKAPSDAALALGIAENTVRTVLKRVFEKMGVSRQSEMAALMGKLFLLRQQASQPTGTGEDRPGLSGP